MGRTKDQFGLTPPEFPPNSPRPPPLVRAADGRKAKGRAEGVRSPAAAAAGPGAQAGRGGGGPARGTAAGRDGMRASGPAWMARLARATYGRLTGKPWGLPGPGRGAKANMKRRAARVRGNEAALRAAAAADPGRAKAGTAAQ